MDKEDLVQQRGKEICKWMRFLPAHTQPNPPHLQIPVCKSSRHCHLHDPEEKAKAQKGQVTLPRLQRSTHETCSSAPDRWTSRACTDDHPASSLTGVIRNKYSTIHKGTSQFLFCIIQSTICVASCLLLSEHSPSGYEVIHRVPPHFNDSISMGHIIYRHRDGTFANPLEGGESKKVPSTLQWGWDSNYSGTCHCPHYESKLNK